MSIVAKTIKFCLRCVGYFSPSLSGWAAYQVFIRPLSSKRVVSPQLQAQIDAALAIADSQLIETSAGSVMLHHWAAKGSSNPTAKVLLLHGWTSRSDYMLNYVSPLLEHGISCYAMDFPAHGRSDGKTLLYTQAVTAIQEIQWLIGPLSAQIGHSFGGSMSMMALRSGANKPVASPPQHLILVAAPASLGRVAKHFARLLGLSPKTQHHYERHLLSASSLSISDLTCEAVAPLYQGRLTIVHDEGDSEVSYENAMAINAAFTGSELITTEGLGHRRILREPEITDQIIKHVVDGISGNVV